MDDDPDARARAAVDRALASYLDTALPRIEELHASLAPLTDELRNFVLGGGKRVRPQLLLLGYAAAGGEDPADVMGPAVALELLHTCALLHDDIIDAAPTRRGRPTAHRRFATHHLEAAWAGDSDAYGEGTALLLGDLAFVLADGAFLAADVPPERLLAGLERFTLLREEVMAGQYVDLYAATSRSTSRELALAVATYKSGRYSVTRPLEVGAVLGGGDAALVEGLRRVGDPLGRAFQVRDDLLGVFGTEDEMGKSVASDLAEGKRTLLVAETMARLDDDDRAHFEALLGKSSLTGEEAEWLRERMRTSGGLDAARDYVEAAVSEALAALDALTVDAEVADALRRMATFIRDRRS